MYLYAQSHLIQTQSTVPGGPSTDIGIKTEASTHHSSIVNGVITESHGNNNNNANVCNNSSADPAVPWELGRRLVKATEAGEEAAIREVGQNYDP